MQIFWTNVQIFSKKRADFLEKLSGARKFAKKYTQIYGKVQTFWDPTWVFKKESLMGSSFCGPGRGGNHVAFYRILPPKKQKIIQDCVGLCGPQFPPANVQIGKEILLDFKHESPTHNFRTRPIPTWQGERPGRGGRWGGGQCAAPGGPLRAHGPTATGGAAGWGWRAGGRAARPPGGGEQCRSSLMCSVLEPPWLCLATAWRLCSSAHSPASWNTPAGRGSSPNNQGVHTVVPTPPRGPQMLPSTVFIRPP